MQLAQRPVVPFHPLWLVAGAAVILFVVYDVIVTTLHRGGGPVTRLLTAPLWRALIHKRLRAVSTHRAMSIAGLALVLLTVGLWIALLWAGWTMMFMGHADAVLQSDYTSASPIDRVYFTGFTIFTLGIGDFVPGGPVYRILCTVASLSGFFIVTFAVTYLMPVVQAAAAKRALADRIATLGANPGAILAHAWDGRRLSVLEDVLANLIEGLAQARQNHLAYPVLHFFHSAEPEQSLAVAVTRLDEALWVAQTSSDLPLLHAGVCERWHLMVERLVDTMGIDDQQEGEVPPLQPLHRARSAGVPLVGDHDAVRRLEPAAGARRRSLALVKAHGWDWDAVIGESPASEDEEAEERRRERREQPAH